MITGWWRTLLACCKLVGEAVGRGGALQVRVDEGGGGDDDIMMVMMMIMRGVWTLDCRDRGLFM